MSANNVLDLSPVSVRRLPKKTGLTIVSQSVGFEGDALRLLVPSESAGLVSSRDHSQGSASFPHTRARGKYGALLEITSAYSTNEVELHGLADTFPIVQLMPKNNVLIVSSRCQRYKDGTHDLNAKIYDSNGKLQNEFLLGDGIEDAQVDRRGNIWVGYFDEGVYGNFGWGGNGDAAPVGAAGLLCFSPLGEKLWKYQPVSATDDISDVYALNVFGDEAWAYYYTGFPVVRVGRDWKVDAWTTATRGARAFAVGNGKMLLFGGYGHHRNACRSLQLSHGEASLAHDVSLLLNEGGTLSEARVIGRGNVLHVFAGEIWYQYSTGSLP